MTVVGLVLSLVLLATAVPIPDEDWGYVPIRGSAQMFWWLYGKSNQNQRNTAPLVIWLQGGPGASSTGFGNFMEIGPLDINLKPRPHNWVESANVLFIDNPVGSGYSYVTDPSGYVTTDEQIGKDLVTLMQGFYQRYPELTKNPLWIFCESYGGKSATAFGVEILKSSLNVNFKGVALGDAWIDPISFVMEWAPYLYATSEIEQSGFDHIQTYANMTRDAVNKKQWSQATNLWGSCENAVEDVSAGVNFYNILDRSSGNQQLFAFGNDDRDLPTLMNTVIRQKLKIIPSNVTWGGQSNAVFNRMSTAFMQPIIHGVDTLLTKGVQVVIYSGNLDLICCTTGTVEWMKQLTWPSMKSFWSSQRRTVLDSKGTVVGFKKEYSNLQFWTILAAGHMVPSDQPEASQIMLEKIISK